MSSKVKEKDIQNAILDYLAHCPGRYWANNNTGTYDPVKKCFRRTPRHFIAGVSDIIGVLPDGTFVAIEVKTPKGRLSESQKIFLNNIQECNGIAFVARSVLEVKDRLDEIRRDKGC